MKIETVLCTLFSCPLLPFQTEQVLLLHTYKTNTYAYMIFGNSNEKAKYSAVRSKEHNLRRYSFMHMPRSRVYMTHGLWMRKNVKETLVHLHNRDTAFIFS